MSDTVLLRMRNVSDQKLLRKSEHIMCSNKVFLKILLFMRQYWKML